MPSVVVKQAKNILESKKNPVASLRKMQLLPSSWNFSVIANFSLQDPHIERGSGFRREN